MGKLTVADYQDVLNENKKLVRELDIIMNGENAAKQASLCDIVLQLKDDWKLYREARDTLVMASIIDKSGICMKFVNKIDSRHPEFNK